MRDVLDHPRHSIPAMTSSAIDKARAFEAENAQRPQVDLPVDHVLHAGLYARTVKLPPDGVMTGALIRIATLLIVRGDVVAYLGGGAIRLQGYHVLPAEAGRKQVFVAVKETHLTMIFPTAAKTVAEAEAEFTDEAHLLQSRRAACPA